MPKKSFITISTQLNFHLVVNYLTSNLFVPSATLTIRIDDVNDNRPRFQKRHYRQAVTENTKPGSPIVTVVAEDADKNRSLTYSLQGNADIIGLVGMDKKSGM